MKKKECPSCAMEIDDKSNVCPVCGYEFAKMGNAIKLVAIVLLIVILLYLIF